MGFIVTASGARQPVFPPDVPQYDPQWFDERERHLLSKGWEKDAAPSAVPTYLDPKGSRLKGEVRHVTDLPNKGDDLNKTIPVHQFHVPSATYNFTLEEALDIQRRRDALGDNGPSPLERLGTCEQRCNALERELENMKARIMVMLKAHPITLEGLKLGLRELIGA